MTNHASEGDRYHGSAFFSYGFRPFFLSAALFAGLAIPLWVFMLGGVGGAELLYPSRDWHVHEMVFGFLPAVITGFLLTAIPNWTDRTPIRGRELMGLWILWLAGRVLIAAPGATPLLSAVVDVAFLVAVAGIVWREIIMAKSWFHAPMAVLITVYAVANGLFHMQALSGRMTDVPERMALGLVMLLLALIGGRVTPNFTSELLAQHGLTQQPAPFSRFDGLSVALVAIAAVAWTVEPLASVTGGILVAAGLVNLLRLSRWHGWLTLREPLVLILHVGYGWLVIALLVLGCSILGFGLAITDAMHALTTGAVGVMTLGVMTRASLGHTGRPRHAGTATRFIYMLVALGALVRVFGPTTGLTTNLILGLAALCWSGAYLLFAMFYGPYLVRPSLEE